MPNANKIAPALNLSVNPTVYRVVKNPRETGARRERSRRDRRGQIQKTKGET